MKMRTFIQLSPSALIGTIGTAQASPMDTPDPFTATHVYATVAPKHGHLLSHRHQHRQLAAMLIDVNVFIRRVLILLRMGSG